MATIMDVARRAGVSRSTVSLVLNQSPLVKNETRVMVEDVIRQMGYVPNNNARGLSARMTNNLGVVYMDDVVQGNDTFCYDFDQRTGMASFNIGNGIMAGLADTKYGIITERFNSVAEPEQLPMVVRTSRVDGVFIVGAPCSPQLVENLQKNGIPFVMVGVDSNAPGVDSVMADPGEGTALALRYLLEMGHRDVCLVNCPSAFHSNFVRTRAFQQTADACGLPVVGRHEIICDRNRGESGYRAFQAYWEAGNRPEGLVTANGHIALGVMRYLYEQRIRIPDDISIIPYEDSSLCGYAVPGLTSVNIRKEMIGAKAAKCLVERIRNPEKETEHIVIPPYLVCRDSVKDRRK